jgi:two-component system, LytTR family, response regulator
MDHSEVRLKCIIIDDEPLALGLIESYIKKIPYLQLMGSFEDPFRALMLLKDQQIDLLFLDINMPDISGMEFFKSIKNPPQVIFITAYDQFAVQGFELQAIDYLLKPVSFQRFLLASDRALEHFRTRTKTIPASPQPANPAEFIFIKSEHNVIKLLLRDIHFIEGYKDYVKIYTSDARPILTITTFKSLEQILPAHTFIRIHKSFIISIEKIISFRNGKVLVKDKHIPIGESYKELFQEKVVAGRL